MEPSWSVSPSQNGPLHRFLIQKALIDGQFNPPGVVLPVSAAILDDLLGYRAVLEDYSVPTLRAIEWEPTADGNVEVTNVAAYLYHVFTRATDQETAALEQAVQDSGIVPRDEACRATE